MQSSLNFIMINTPMNLRHPASGKHKLLCALYVKFYLPKLLSVLILETTFVNWWFLTSQISCEVCVRVCPIDLPVVDWKLETDIRKKRLLNYSIDFEICIFCGNCIEYCPTNCLSMTEEYELSTYDRHELNYNQIALGRLPMSVIDDYTIRTIQIK
ncbi:NAD(P)H-quinone oxidoreductase subunit I, putative [Medicago truncatula]|uniref:NAD(P)H-quinone oxidoreductase subunit I, putative n=1 Tax=Medicago truncatula TaxID=3880 RepID=G7KAD3_MEDTR|nr:NAD(P)H-quinone oxidoreductase subunit I, putative [Medicago truncatula]